MKIVSRFVYILASASLCLGLSAVANAQDIQTVSVKFPYPVTVGAKTLPAGEYTISTFDVSTDSPIFLIRGMRGAAITFASARSSAPNHPLTKDDVVIEVTGDKHVLSQVRLQNSDSTYDLVRTSAK